MGVKGIEYTNPTHGRISIPAGYPELVKQISSVVHAGPDKWIGVQVGLETGSDKLALTHMPNKTLPLKIGPDGTWQQIVAEGVKGMNRGYWRPAFTVQVGQMDETPDDNWETVAMVNRLSNMDVGSSSLRVHRYTDAERPAWTDKEQESSPQRCSTSHSSPSTTPATGISRR